MKAVVQGLMEIKQGNTMSLPEVEKALGIQSLREAIVAGEASGKSGLSLADVAAQVKARH